MIKKFLGIVCLLYSILFGYVLIFDKLKYFLAPGMHIYFKLSLLPMVILGFVLIFYNKISYKFKISDVFLLLPLFFIILAGDCKLTASLASNRTSNYNKVVKVSNDNSKEVELYDDDSKDMDDVNLDQKYDFTNVYFDVIDEAYVELASYISYSPKNSKYVGKTIRVRGFASKYASYIPNGFFTLGKYEISCCAADASFVGFYVKYDPTKVIQNRWYEIEGILKSGKDAEGYNILYIDVVNINKIDSSSEEQYIYPCYSYGNGLCEEAIKYNLEK